jgi:hypothetical protein
MFGVWKVTKTNCGSYVARVLPAWQIWPAALPPCFLHAFMSWCYRDIMMNHTSVLFHKIEFLYYCFTNGYIKSSQIFLGSRCSDWLRAGRPRGRNSSPRRVKSFLFFTSSRPVLGPNQPPMQCLPWAFLGGEAAGAWSWQLVPSSRKCGSIHPPPPHTRLHGVVIN